MLITDIFQIMPDLFERSQIVTFPTQLFFSIDKTAWYVISITARVRSEKQRGKQETDDEELTVELDRITFPKPNTNNNLKDAPAAFSGGSQHNEEKTVKIITTLAQGNHQLILTPQHQAELVSIWYQQLTLTNDKISFAITEQTKNLDKQPWMTFALVSQRFTQVTIKAKVWWHFFNGDDIQIKINNNIIPHATNTKWHKYWLFHARPLLDIFGREQVEIHSLTETLAMQHISYVELWTNRTPLLQEIIFEGNDLQKEVEMAVASFQVQKSSDSYS